MSYQTGRILLGRSLLLQAAEDPDMLSVLDLIRGTTACKDSSSRLYTYNLRYGFVGV